MNSIKIEQKKANALRKERLKERQRKNGSLKTGPESISTRLRILGYRSYREYLLSEHWKSIKYRFFRSCHSTKNAEGKLRCAFCEKTTNLQVHHRTYISLGHESLDQLTLLCDEHHELAHEIHKKNPIRVKKLSLKQATKRAKNKVKKEQAKLKQQLQQKQEKAMLLVKEYIK